MTVQQRFRRQRVESSAGLVARRPPLSPPVARRVRLAPSLVAIGVVAALVTVAVWASTPTMAVAVAAIGVGITAWGWLRAQKRRRWEIAYDELVRLWRPLATSAGFPSPRTFAALLAPEAGLTTLEGCEAERAELLAWCTDPTSAPVRVLAGVSGVGKSRLGVELAVALPGEWTAGVARPGMTAQVVAAAAAVGARRPVLVVVDHADVEPTADIIAVFRQAGAARNRVRVLMLVRDADAFGTVLDEQGAGGRWESTTLPVIGVDGDRRRFFADAVRAFDALPDEAPLPPWAVAEPGPVGVEGEPMAITQARAALAVLADDPDDALAMRTADLARLADEIVAHEKRRWKTDALEPAAQEEALLTLLVRDPHGVEGAIGILRTLPRCRDRDEHALRDIATWARMLYPADADEHLDGPWLDARPELLHGSLLALAIERHRARMVEAVDDDPQVFLRIDRATSCHPRRSELVRSLLTDVRLVPVIEVAVLGNALDLRADLAEALTDRALTGAEVARLLPITEAPRWSPVRVALRRAEVQHLRGPDAGNPDSDHRALLARALSDLGGALRNAGAYDDALAPTREALELYRDLVGAHPDRHRADLAAALTGLSASLRALGSNDAALCAVREAAQLYRDLGLDHSHDLARSLTDLGGVLLETGSPEDARTACREAVRLSQDLAATGPARHIPDLAAALAGLGASLRELGPDDEALTVTREAVRLYRDVAANTTDRHSPDLARSLTDLGAVLRETGAPDEALAVCREAVQRYQDLAATDRDRHLSDLARSLALLGATLRDVGAYQAGVAACVDAVRLHRELAAVEAARYTPHLARSLADLGISLRGREPHDEGLAPGLEAVQLNRELVAADPARHTPDLARSLTDLGISLRGRAAHGDALAATSEAVRLGRDLAAVHPARHTPELCRSLISLGAGLRALGRRSEAVLYEGEAVAWWWHLSTQCPGEFDERYRDAQRRYFRTFSLCDHEPEDLLTAELVARSHVQAYVEHIAASRCTEDVLVDG